MNEFSVKTQVIGTVALVDVIGFLEATANKVLADSLEQLQKQGFLRYVIDFSGCQVMSSPGIHDLIQFALRLSDTPGGKLVFSGLNAMQTKVFKLVALDTVATICPTRVEALAEAERDGEAAPTAP